MEKPVVLFVDDDENIRSLVRYNLKLDGFEVLLANDGKQGFEMAKKHVPDIILLDIMMPEQDGLETLVDLRDDPVTQKIVVVMLTAKGMIIDMEKAYSLGADHYISKPFEPDILGQTLRRKLKIK